MKLPLHLEDMLTITHEIEALGVDLLGLGALEEVDDCTVVIVGALEAWDTLETLASGRDAPRC
jgi:hypothetical protein